MARVVRACRARGCGEPAASRGLCQGHLSRWRRTGRLDEDRPLVPRSATPRDRFMLHVREEGGHWIWTGRLDDDGYGRWALPGEGPSGAHRAAYRLFVGSIPEGHEVDHTCRVRACVRPAHLEAVPQLVNSERRDAALGWGKSRRLCRRGHPMIGDNVMVRGNGARRCRACHVAYMAAYRAR